MKILSASQSMGLLVIIAMASPLAIADDKAGWYIGGSIGSSRTDIDRDGIISGLSTHGFNTSSLSTNDHDIGYKLLGGYQFNRNLALEGGYFDLGKFDYKAITLPQGSMEGEIKVKGFNFDVVGTLNFTERFSGLARAGLIATRSKDQFDGTGAVTPTSSSPNENDIYYKYGVGLQYALTPALNLRVEAERYRINDAIDNTGDVDLISAGLTYRFGAKKNKVVVLVVEPKVEKKVERAIIENKVVVLALEDVHFEFDQSGLTLSAQKVIDENIKLLKKNPNAKIRIAGYTSAAGSSDYNQTLSEQRAQAVKDYLVARGIKKEQLAVIGYGKHNPAMHESAPKNLYSTAAKANMRVLFEIDIK